eukprot:FR742991.1.p1 GENE.FR742991.1~~FR742991.1.p1  ORF type:complete len:152 (+),score=6.55 FR742991.1:494-949(+)
MYLMPTSSSSITETSSGTRGCCIAACPTLDRIFCRFVPPASVHICVWLLACLSTASEAIYPPVLLHAKHNTCNDLLGFRLCSSEADIHVSTCFYTRPPRRGPPPFFPSLKLYFPLVPSFGRGGFGFHLVFPFPSPLKFQFPTPKGEKPGVA